MNFTAIWLYILSLFHLRIVELIRRVEPVDYGDKIFNQFVQDYTISWKPFRQEVVVFEQQCLAQCTRDFRCFSFEVMTLSNNEWECSFFDVIYESTNRTLMKRNGAKYFSRYLHHQDCASWCKAGATEDGVYDVLLLGTHHIQVICDMKTFGGGWTVFQRRSHRKIDFDRNWNEYKEGFNRPGGVYWLGNKYLHMITASQKQDLYVRAMSFDRQHNKKWFNGFSVGSEKESYTFRYEKVKDDYKSYPSLFHYEDGQPFSTKDRNSIQVNCSETFGGGWWWKENHCEDQDSMNGRYPDKKYEEGQFPLHGGIKWVAWKGKKTSLKLSKLMIRPSSF